MGLIQTIKEKFNMKPDPWGEDRLDSENTKEIVSPSGKYRLVVRYYNQGKGYWKYSRGTAYRISDGAEVADIKRNYSLFNHTFVTKGGHEYLISGRSYMGQTIVNLDTGVESNDSEWAGGKYSGVGFCWAQHMLSPDGNTLLVDGCVWASPYEYRFYDFTDPLSQGWPELSIIGLDGKPTYIYANNEDKNPEFVGDRVVCYETTSVFKPTKQRENDISVEEMEVLGDAYDNEDNWEEVVDARIVLRRIGNEMRVVEWWKSEYKQEQERQAEAFSKKFEEKTKAFHKTERCKRLMALMEKHDVPTKYATGWRAWKNWEVNFTLRRKDPKASVDMTWETEGDEKIEVRVYDKTGNNPQKTTFPNDEKGYEEALQLVESVFTR